MHGELIYIIYTFIFDFFSDVNNLNGVGITQYEISDLIFTWVFGTWKHGYSSYYVFLMDEWGFSISDCASIYITNIITIIIIVLLFLAMIKLFKWIFNLIFKLMRLN